MGKPTVSDAILDQILGRRGGEVGSPSGEPDDRPPDEQQGEDSLVIACEELLQAIRRGDAHAMAEAFRSALVLADSDTPGAYCGGSVDRR